MNSELAIELKVGIQLVLYLLIMSAQVANFWVTAHLSMKWLYFIVYSSLLYQSGYFLTIIERP